MLKELLKLSNGNPLDIEYPIILKNSEGEVIYFEDSEGFCRKSEYANGKETHYENSSGYWSISEYTNGKQTYFENSEGVKRGTPKNSKKTKILESIEDLKSQIKSLQEEAEEL